MKARFRLLDVEKMDATLTVTMNVEQWKIVEEKLKDSSYHTVSHRFHSLVKELIAHAYKEYAMEQKGTGE